MTDFQPTSTFTAPLTAPTQGGTSSTNKPAPYPQLLATIGSALGIAEPPPIPPTTTRLVAIAVQPHGLLHPPSQHRLCAAALADDSLAMYNLQTNQWSPHKLANTQQKQVTCLRWQPQSASVLAVGCAKGVCVWRLAFSGTAELAGGHLLRVIEIFGGPESFPTPPSSLRWHPLGSWLAISSTHHGGIALCDLSTTSAPTTLPYHSYGPLGLAHSLLAYLIGSSLHRSGVGVLEVSLCGSSLMASGSHGGLRIYETKEWTWESWPRFGRDAPVNAAAWHGPPPLSSESLRTLVLSLTNDTTLHVLRVGRRSAGGPSSEYIGHIELSHLCPSLSENGNNGESSSSQQLPVRRQSEGLSFLGRSARRQSEGGMDVDGAGVAAAAAGGGGAVAGGGAKGHIVSLCWEPRGERLVLGWGYPTGGGGVSVLSTRTAPSFQAHALGKVRLSDAAMGNAPLRALDLSLDGSGTVLAVGSQDGQVALVPLGV